MTFLKRLLIELNNAKSVAIFTHKNSDHDDICSAVSLQEMLHQLGFNSTIFVDKMPSPSILHFTPNAKFEFSSNQSFDVGISVDCASINLLSEENLKVFQRTKTTFNIDHHKDNTNYATFNFVKKGWSSCCEVLFDLFKKQITLNENLATMLYAGIFMDCGCFCYNSVSSKTHKCVAELLKFCPDVNDNFFVCFGVAGQEHFEITKLAFDSVKFFENGKIAVSVLRREDFQKANCKREDGKFIVTYLQNISGVKIAISISEDDPNEWRISLRTASHIDVSKIAQRFNGGGHQRASGLSLKGDFNKALGALLAECKKALKNQN